MKPQYYRCQTDLLATCHTESTAISDVSLTIECSPRRPPAPQASTLHAEGVNKSPDDDQCSRAFRTNAHEFKGNDTQKSLLGVCYRDTPRSTYNATQSLWCFGSSSSAPLPFDQRGPARSACAHLILHLPCTICSLTNDSFNVLKIRGHIHSRFPISISVVSVVVGYTPNAPVPNNYFDLEQTPSRFSEASENAQTNTSFTRTLLRVFGARPRSRQSHPLDIHTYKTHTLVLERDVVVKGLCTTSRALVH